MRNTSHNALCVKKKIAPSDYNDDENCTLVSAKTGNRVVIPVILMKALRDGTIKLAPGGEICTLS